MGIDPPDSATVQATLSDERHDFAMKHDRRRVHPLVLSQKRATAALVADQELAQYEWMAADLPCAEERVETGSRR